MEKYSLLHRYMTLDEKGLWVKSKDAEKLQSDKQTLLEAGNKLHTQLNDLMKFCVDHGHLDYEDDSDGMIQFKEVMTEWNDIIKANT